MLKDATYTEKYQLLKDELIGIVSTIRKDLKQEHLKKDFAFLKTAFAGKQQNKISNEELLEVYQPHLMEGDPKVWELVIERWLFKHTEIYDFFEERLKQISADFTVLQEIEGSQALFLMQESIKEFGAENTYIFSVLNSVVFPKKIYDELKKLSREERQKKHETTQQVTATESVEELKKKHQDELKKLQERYDKKLEGMQKKYLHDVEGLKKQIAALQRKMTHVSV